MANICPVCNKKISIFEEDWSRRKYLHRDCVKEFDLQPEKYGVNPKPETAKTEAETAKTKPETAKTKPETAKTEAEAPEKKRLENEKVEKDSESFIKRNAKKIDFALLFATLLFTIIFMSQFDSNRGLWDKIFYVSSTGAIRGLDDGGVILLYIFTPYILWRVIYHYWLKDRRAG